VYYQRAIIATICPADNATAGCLGRRRAGQLRFGFVAVLKGHIVYRRFRERTENHFRAVYNLLNGDFAAFCAVCSTLGARLLPDFLKYGQKCF
jgi:hypothetical protein